MSGQCCQDVIIGDKAINLCFEAFDRDHESSNATNHAYLEAMPINHTQ